MNDKQCLRIEFYCRTPLPSSAKPPVLWIVLLWMAVIFSPFVSFTISGKVSDENWLPTYMVGGGALITVITIHFRTMLNFRKLPEELRHEYSKGKLFPASDMPWHGDRTFHLGGSKRVLALSKHGIHFSPAALRSASFSLVKEYAKVNMLSSMSNMNDDALHFIPWADIEEWQVHTDSDAPDYYHICLPGNRNARLCRVPSSDEEYDLLDTVRSLGQTDVRIFCDIEPPQKK